MPKRVSTQNTKEISGNGKKINYRMRRRIRRTVASVSLITAIIVATIPIPDVSADDGQQPSKDRKSVV